MTEEEVLSWMKQYLDGSEPEKTAYGMIMSDISEYGFEAWLDMPAIVVVEMYVDATEEVGQSLVNDFKNMLSQEAVLDDLDIVQSMRLDPVLAMGAFKDGVMDVFRSLLIYLTTQEMANAYHKDDTY